MESMDLSLARHRRAVRRLCRDVDAVDSVAAVLVEAERRMVEATFCLRDIGQVGAVREVRALAVLDAGISDVRAALGTDEAES